MMPTSEASKRANVKYLLKHNLVEIKFRVTEDKRDEYKSKAKSLGFSSFNKFVIEAIEEKLSKEYK